MSLSGRLIICPTEAAQKGFLMSQREGLGGGGDFLHTSVCGVHVLVPAIRVAGFWRGSFLVDPFMGSGSLLVRKVLVQFLDAFLNSPQFCAVQFSFE